MEKTLLRLPLGISDFPEIREGDYAFVDKTRTIEKLDPDFSNSSETAFS